MTESTLARRTALLGRSSALALLIALAPQAVLAQATDTASPNSQSAAPTPISAGAVSKAAPEGDAEEQIIVTGSRLAPPNSVSFAPITSVSGDSLVRATGSVSIGDKLNELPGLRPTYSQQNSTAGLGTAGINAVDLYGLGVQRTLVLVNGRRHVSPSILNLNGQGVDINTIPVSLLERVDILTGGGSSLYGSDAIAGVVNFVLKQSYDGIEANVRGGTSQYGDAGAYLATITAGKNFAEGRGNIAGAVEYAHQTDFYGSDRPNIGRVSGFVTTETDPAGSLNGAANNPDRRFFNDIRSATLSFGGLFSAASPTGACGRDAATNATPNAAFRCTFLFQSDGTLVPQTGTRVGVAPNGNYIGGNGNTGREGRILVLQPRQDRFNFNLIGHYEISPAIVPYFEAKYVKIHTTGSTSGPAFIQGATLGSFGYNTTATVPGGSSGSLYYERPALNNPYLSDQARSVLTTQLLTQINANINPQSTSGGTYANTVAGQALRAADLAAVNAGTYRFNFSKNLTDLGLRNEDSRRRTFRIVAGVRGDLGSGFSYDVSGNYGETRENTTLQGNLNTQRFLLAMDTARNASGQIVCASQITASRAASAQLPGSSAAQLATDIAACQPINPFGEGNISQAARNYVLQDTRAQSRIRQTDIVGYVKYDSGSWFELPGGAIGVLIGGEYRRETNLYRQDPLVNQGYTFYNAISTLSAPAFQVKEAFGEIRVPLLKDMPFFKDLTLSGSGRISHYKGSIGTVYTYNGGADWAPVQDIKFRGSYSRSVRAPSIRELYQTQSANFASQFTDPCSLRNIAAGPATRLTNCRAAGVPAAYDFVYSASLAIRSGGNPDLKAEQSDSITGGVVLTPRWVPGLTFSADYYNIRVKNVITTVAAQTIVNQCYDSASLANAFCALFSRNGSGVGPSGEEPYRILENSLLSSGINFAKLKAQGVNVSANYRHNFMGIAEISAQGLYSHVFKRSNYLNPIDPNRETKLRGTLSYPIDEFKIDLDARRGQVSIGYTMRFIGHVVLNNWEDTHSVQGRPPENLDYADIQYYPNVFYHNLRGSVDVTSKLNMFAGIDNVTNRKPPFGITGVSGTTAGGNYDVRGRYFYAGARIRM